MITNERQYSITKSQLAKLEFAIESFDFQETAKRVGSKELAKAELNALKSEAATIAEQLNEYEALKSGVVTVLKAESLESLPSILVRARIARGFTQKELATKLGLKEQQIQRYESEDYRSASLPRLGAVANALGLSISEVAEFREVSSIGTSEKLERLDWSQFPVSEMYRRQWFRGFSGTLNAAKIEASSLLEQFVRESFQKPTLALHRRRIRARSKIDDYALFAWECRVLSLAKDSPAVGRYSPEALDENWFKELAQESRYDDGPKRAMEHLRKAGITLVVEPHLPRTHLDGAAILYEGQAVVGLTLRYDRLDNFWFVLMHELIHIVKHLRKGGVNRIFDDIEAEADKLERETDELAGRALIPADIWETALARYVRTDETIIELANQLKIHPAIIAGRIRNEARNFVLFGDLVGQGKVREQFPEVIFGQ